MEKKAGKKTQARIYKVWTYDVWGNANDGYDVNDRSSAGKVIIRCKRKVFNEGTAHEFTSYDPTNLQLSRAVGGRGLSWDGESDSTLYAEQKSDGRPECELEFCYFLSKEDGI